MHNQLYIRNDWGVRAQKTETHKLTKIKTKLFSKFSSVNSQQKKTLIHKFRKKKLLTQKNIPIRLQKKAKSLGIALSVKYNTKLNTYFASIFDVNRKIVFDVRTSKRIKMNQTVVLSLEVSFQSQICNVLSGMPVANYQQVRDLIKLKTKNILQEFDLRSHILKILTNLINSKFTTSKIIFKKVLSMFQNAHDPVRVAKEALSLLGYFKTSTLIRYSIRLFEFFTGIPLLSFLEFLLGFVFFPVVFTEFNIEMKPNGDDSRYWRRFDGTEIFEGPKKLFWKYPCGKTVHHFLDEGRVEMALSNGRLIRIIANGNMLVQDPDGSLRTVAAGGQVDLIRNPLRGHHNVDGVLVDRKSFPVNPLDRRAVEALLDKIQCPQLIDVLNTGTGEITSKSMLELRRRR